MANANDGRSSAGQSLATVWSLHYLRAVAALGVVLFHCLGDAGFDFHLGAAGIHLFFTLSGFMMWSIGGHAATRPGPFLFGRIRRIVPMYWIGTAVAVASTWVLPGFYYQSQRQVVPIVKSLFFIPQYGIQGGVYPVLYLGWTLQYEMYFYLLFALCLFAPARLRFAMLATTFAVLAAIGMIFQPQSPALQTYTNPICLEFLAGAVVARLPWRFASPALAVCVAVVSAFTFCLCDRYEDLLGYFAPFALATTAALLIVGLLSLERQDRMPHNRFLLLLGEASFAIYLFQDLGFALALPIAGGLAPLLRALISMVCAAMTGVAIHLALERPLTAWMKRATRRSGIVEAKVAPLPLVAEP